MEIKFRHNNSLVLIQCNKSDLMKDIFQKYITKTGLDINKIYFLSNGNIIDNKFYESSIKELTNENIFDIQVYDIEMNNPEKKNKLKKSNIIVCSECKGLCRLEVKNYQIKLFGCENGHIINDISINDFNETQYIDESKIICDICKFAKKNEQYNNEFNYCNTCKKNLCLLCKCNHDKSHIIIDYDKKHYLCHKHNEKFISYCNACNKNLCFDCEVEHKKSHKIKSFKDFSYNKGELSKDIKKFQERITKVNEKIEEIINIMNDLKKNIEKYNDIFYNILNNYENDNRNYYILQNIDELLNNSIIQDLDYICDSKSNNINYRFKIFMKMYIKMNINNISDELIRNQYDFEIEEFKSVKYSNLEETKLLYKYGENSICKMVNSDYKEILGIGFFIPIDESFKLPFKSALFTCNHIFPEGFFNKNEYIYFIHNNTKKQLYIKERQIFSNNLNYLDFHENFGKRKIFVDKELDYTLIEILNSDYIIDKKFELFKIESLNQKNFSDIAILHYPIDEGLSFSLGKFQKKNDDSLVYNCSTSLGSEGAPIIDINDNQSIIGIHSRNIGKFGLGHSMDIIFCNIIKNYVKFSENSLKNNFKTLKIHKGNIINIILLDDNTLCSCSNDGIVNFLNITKFEISNEPIKEKEEILYHTKLSDNSIILCCKDGTLKIYKEEVENTLNKISNIIFNTSFFPTKSIQSLFSNKKEVNQVSETNEINKPNETNEANQENQINKENEIKEKAVINQTDQINKKYGLLETLKEHQDSVCQVIEMSEGLIISCGLDAKMKIWKKKGYNFTCINTMIVNDEPGFPANILKIKENEIVSAATNANYIIFWNINTFKKIKKIDNIVCHWNRNSMKMIDDNTLCIGGNGNTGIYFIDCIKYQLICNIKIDNIYSISAIIKLDNGNILIGCKKENKSKEEDKSYTYCLSEYKYNLKEKTLFKVRSKIDAHTNTITGLVNLSHNEIVSYSFDKTIKFWI